MEAARGDIGVVADDCRGIAAQFEHESLGSGGPGHGRSGGDAAGEADHADRGRRAQALADIAASVQQLHGLRRGAGLEQQRDDGRGHGRGLRRRLDDRGVAGRERRAELVGEEVGRRVERGDGQRHPDRRPVGQRGVADATGPAGDRQDVAADLAGLGRAHGQRVGHPVQLATAVFDRLAQFEGDEPGNGGPVLDGQRGRALEDRGPGRRGQPGDGPGGVGSVGKGRVDVGRLRLGRAADRRPQVGPDSLEDRTAVGPLPSKVGRRHDRVVRRPKNRAQHPHSLVIHWTVPLDH